ncbi:cystatin-like fold lipoprotein [Staphylococcus epidermidis]|uniref:cystatin-like fold lipoprotein n=1 Tax=Staphylococcus epidermidis TaxID=1282 RepID=UPI0036D2616A
MKKLCIGVLIIMMSIINSSCSHDQKENKYQSQIDKVMEIQQETHKEMVKKSDQVAPKFNKDKVNTYVFEDSKLIVLSYKLFKDKDQLFYATYEFKDDKIYYKRDIDSKTYVKNHHSDYKDIKVK